MKLFSSSSLPNPFMFFRWLLRRDWLLQIGEALVERFGEINNFGSALSFRDPVRHRLALNLRSNDRFEFLAVGVTVFLGLKRAGE